MHVARGVRRGKISGLICGAARKSELPTAVEPDQVQCAFLSSAGPTGAPGAPGADGINGIDGADGTPGGPGAPGVLCSLVCSLVSSYLWQEIQLPACKTATC